MAQSNCSNDDENPILNKENLIKKFIFAAVDNEGLSNDIIAEIDQDDFTITAIALAGTNVTNLVPTIEISKDATVNPNSKIAADFSNPVTYTVTAQDGTTQEYKVTVTVTDPIASEEKTINNFTFTAVDNNGLSNDIIAEIDQDGHTITAVVSANTDVTNLIPTITLSNDATVNPNSKIAADFSNPVTYTVTAQDGTTQEYIVTITVTDPVGSEEKTINRFTFIAVDNDALSNDITAVINQDDFTITAIALAGTNVTNLVPTIEISNDATVNPNSKVAADFSNPVTYTVTAQDGTTQEYNVTLTVTTIQESNDRNILTIFYNANPDNTLDWDLNAETMESWEGVTIVNNRVTKLILLDNKQISILPPEIGNLDNLEELRFDHNSLAGGIPDEIGNLKNLKNLLFIFTELKSIPVEIGNLRNLNILDLYGNPDLVSIPQAVCDLRTTSNTDILMDPRITCQ